MLWVYQAEVLCRIFGLRFLALKITGTKPEWQKHQQRWDRRMVFQCKKHPNWKYLENQLLLISINFTPKTSHSCLKNGTLGFPGRYWNYYSQNTSIFGFSDALNFPFEAPSIFGTSQSNANRESWWPRHCWKLITPSVARRILKCCAASASREKGMSSFERPEKFSSDFARKPAEIMSVESIYLKRQFGSGIYWCPINGWKLSQTIELSGYQVSNHPLSYNPTQTFALSQWRFSQKTMDLHQV